MTQTKIEAAEDMLRGELGGYMKDSPLENALRSDASAKAIFDAAARVISHMILDPRVVTVLYSGRAFSAEEMRHPGMPPVGRGETIDAALGDWLRLYACEVGVILRIDESAEPFEMTRRLRELSKR